MTLAAIYLLGLAGLSQSNTQPQPSVPITDERCGADLKLYAQVVAQMRQGADYYPVANSELRKWGFPVGCLFNWRLPTYAVCLSWLPGPQAIQRVLWLISLVGLGLILQHELKHLGPVAAAMTGLGLVGVLKWTLDGEAFYAQEVWMAAFVLLSLGLRMHGWHLLACAAGLGALFWRELALPFAVVSLVQALLHRRWRESALGMLGLIGFASLLLWHAHQVQAWVTTEDLRQSTGIWGWVQFGGLTFNVLATRMNGFLYAGPAFAVWGVLCLSLVGLIGWRQESANSCEVRVTAAASTLLYLAAFAVVGQPMNMYWGLAFAPFLPLGFARFPAVLYRLWQVAEWSCEPRIAMTFRRFADGCSPRPAS